MKETPLIPLVKYGNPVLPFQFETIQNLVRYGDEIQGTAHTHNYYEMIWLTKGSGTLYIDLNEYQIETHSVFCIQPNQVHRFEWRPGMEGLVFSFTDAFFNYAERGFDCSSQVEVYQIFSQALHIRVTNEAEPVLKEIAKLMINEYESQFELRLELLKRYFRIFIIYLARLMKAKPQATPQNQEANLVKAFLEILDHNFKEKKMVADYAKKLFITPNYLNRIVKKNTGLSAKHHIKQRVLLEAKRLGRYSGAGMKQIAYSLGFCDTSHFSKYFKAGAGTNFSDFKHERFN